MSRTTLATLAAGGLLLAAAPGVAGAQPAASGPVKRTVHVIDYAFTPSKLSVPRGSTIKFVWPSDGGDSHDVKLTKRPKGAKRFHSPIASSDFTFKRKLRVPGKYRVICTLHVDMRLNITVRR